MEVNLLSESERDRVRVMIKLVVVTAIITLAAIFGFGALTGAGDYFEGGAVGDAAAEDYYWQVWGILLPVGLAILISGGSIFFLAGTFARLRSGWTATVASIVRAVVVPAALLGAFPYLLGPGADLPGWSEAITAIGLMVANATVIGLGAIAFGLKMPRWGGIALILGALAAVATFLPLFTFVGLAIGGAALLRWSDRIAVSPDAQVDSSPVGHG